MGAKPGKAKCYEPLHTNSETLSHTESNDTTAALARVRERVRTQIGSIKVSGRYHIYPRRFEDDYELDQGKILGTGVNGAVYHGRSKLHGEAVAVKAFELCGISKEDRNFLRNELEVFLTLDHPHIMRLRDIYEDAHRVTMVTEILEGGDLLERIVQLNGYSEGDAAQATSQMLRAVLYMHNLDIVHRDIKCEHFLYDTLEGRHLKLIDFGFSRTLKNRRNKKMMHGCGTINYMAPEVLRCLYTNKCDLWSLGVVVYVMLLGTLPFEGKNQEHLFDQILEGSYRTDQAAWANLSSHATQFLKGLLQVNPDERLSAKDALQHPWITMPPEESGDVVDAVRTSVVTSLCQFTKISRFRRACMYMVALSLTNEERMQVRQDFLKMDLDKQGTISFYELKHALQKTVSMPDEEVSHIFNLIDKDCSGRVDYSEFLTAMMSSRIALRSTDVREAFCRFDRDGSGFITLDDLREALGDSYDTCELELMIQEADSSQDGKISLDEFVSYLGGDDAKEHHQEAANRVIDRHLGMSTEGTDTLGSSKLPSPFPCAEEHMPTHGCEIQREKAQTREEGSGKPKRKSMICTLQ